MCQAQWAHMHLLMCSEVVLQSGMQKEKLIQHWYSSSIVILTPLYVSNDRMAGTCWCMEAATARPATSPPPCLCWTPTPGAGLPPKCRCFASSLGLGFACLLHDCLHAEWTVVQAQVCSTLR